MTIFVTFAQSTTQIFSVRHVGLRNALNEIRLHFRFVKLIKYVLPILLTVTASTASADALSDHEAIGYRKRDAGDPVALLAKDLANGKRLLAWDEKSGYLKSLLATLGIPRSSQTLVFSRTSFQRERISPEAPRALYFNDDVYIGTVQGGDFLEIASVDPVNGTMFYSLDQKRPVEDRAPAPHRLTDDCLQCHESGMTDDIPGLLLRSVFTAPTGNPVLSEGTFRTNMQSPLQERWGGWYVTGTHGSVRHMGNAILPEGKPNEALDRESGANVASLAKLVDVEPYLESTSDIVALMVLAHQAQVHNLITRASYHTRLALHDNRVFNEDLQEPLAQTRESTQRRLDSAVEPLVRAMLMSGEAVLTAPIRGTSAFATEFQKRGPRDRRGRHLRKLDLRRRLFAVPLSYLIYNAAFDALPAEARDLFWRRMCEVLSGSDHSPAFAHLSGTDRLVISEILRDTKPAAPVCRP